MLVLRNSTKAIIIENDLILLTVNRDKEGLFYLLPGGGQRHGESLSDALVRECLEETGLHIFVGDLVLVRDYISAHHEFAEDDVDTHQVEFMFRCQVSQGGARVGKLPDKWQSGVEWVPVTELDDIRLYPSAIVEPLKNIASGKPSGICYLGDVN
jgi:8-oxo-dGTP diphosphatase